MAIVIQKRPNDRCWSGNPISYQLYSSAAEADNSISFEIAIWFKRTDESDYSEILRRPHYPVNGTASIDIRDVIDCLLEYELPNLGIGFQYENQLNATRMTGHCYIKFREVTTDNPDGAWSTESANPRFIIKGGIAWKKWRGENYWVNYFDVVKPFLTWHDSGRLASYNERMYLAWLNLTDIAQGSISVRVKTVMTDGTAYYKFIDTSVAKYQVLYFPCGAAQLLLDEVSPDKKIWYWELQVHDITDPGNPVLISVAHKYELDNRFDQNDITLNYRGSTGGLESVRVRGVIEFSLNREFSEIEKAALNDYFVNHFIPGRRSAANSTELVIYKGDIGYLSKEGQDRLRDMHFQRECWKEEDSKWLPVMIMTGSQRLKTSEDKLFSMPIEFAIGSGQDPYYTPDSINLGEGNEVTEPICNAVINDADYIESGGGYTVSWNLVSGAPAKYFISTPGVSGGAPHESIVTNYHFDWLPVGDNVITIKPLCLIGGRYYFGDPITVTIVVPEACIAVDFDGGMPTLPDAQVDVDYLVEVDLTGTAPFYILPDTAIPLWMSVSIVGSKLIISGTPGLGDANSLVQVDISVANCLFNHKQEISQDIVVNP